MSAHHDERERLDLLSNRVVGAALKVHQEIGPGNLERACESCLAFELAEDGLHVERQVELPLVYKGHRLDCGYRIDLLVEDKILVEVKTVDALLPIHASQLLSYLKLSSLQVGLLINFHVRLLKHGIRRFLL